MNARRDELSELMIQALNDEPFITAGLLARRVGASKTRVNNILYSQSKRFTKTDDTPPLWAVARSSADPSPPESELNSPSPMGTRSAASIPFSLHPWQVEALAEWQTNGCRGIVNAVTGAGKTRLAIAAIDVHRRDPGAKVVVVVPTIELLRQWMAELELCFPAAKIGGLGSSFRDSLGDCDILVGVVNSIVLTGGAGLKLGLGQSGLLIGDECHRLASVKFRESLLGEYKRRLGLSATHERMDGLHDEVLIPYFGDVIYEIGYRDAIDQDVIAHVKVALIGVRFTSREAAEYEQHSEDMSDARRMLQGRYGLYGKNPGDFFLEVQRLAKSDDRRSAIDANKYLKPFTARRKLLSESTAKMDSLSLLTGAIEDSNGTIAFTQTIESTHRIVATFQALGIESAAIHSKLKPAERLEVFDRFSAGEIQLISAPMVLDEGVDVPEADLAIIVAASSQRRQMVQRMGRVMRKKPDGRLARFVLMYVRDTLEDPLQGAQESFFDEVLNIADADKRFNDSSLPKDIRRFLSPFGAE